MTQFIVDESSSQTPIGEFLNTFRDDHVEMRNASGELLATVIVPASRAEEDRRYEELQRICEQEADLLRERLSRPPTEGLTTEELFSRLRQLGGDE